MFRQQSWKTDAGRAFGHSVLVCAGLVLTAPLADSRAGAADVVETEAPVYVEERIDTAWEVSIRPLYGWVPGFNGKMGVFGQSPVDLNITPGDILENLDTFFDLLDGLYFGSGQVRRDQIGFFWDVVFIEVQAVDQIGGDFIGGPLNASFSTTKAALAATYRVHETDRSNLDLP